MFQDNVEMVRVIGRCTTSVYLTLMALCCSVDIGIKMNCHCMPSGDYEVNKAVLSLSSKLTLGDILQVEG